MTREEAIKILKPIRDTYVDHANIAMTVEADNNAEALEMAVEALKQLEIIRCGECKYREIRGVEGFCDHITGEEIMVRKTDYCKWAERRTEGTNE